MKNYLKNFAIAMMIGISSVSIAQAQTQPTQQNVVEINGKKYIEASKDGITSSTIRNEAEQWGKLSSAMADAIINAAEKLGVAANNFADTYLGKIIIFLVVWSYFGAAAIDIILGITLLIVTWTISITFILKAGIKPYEEKVVPYLFGFWNRKIKVTTASSNHEYHYDSDMRTVYITIGCVVGVIGTIIGLVIAL